MDLADRSEMKLDEMIVSQWFYVSRNLERELILGGDWLWSKTVIKFNPPKLKLVDEKILLEMEPAEQVKVLTGYNTKIPPSTAAAHASKLEFPNGKRRRLSLLLSFVPKMKSYTFFKD